MKIEQQQALIEESGICPECEGERVTCSTCKGTGVFPPPDKVCDWQVALAEYAKLREEIGQLEETGECSCDPNEFHTCGLCRKTAALDGRARTLMHLWGDTWAMKLFAVIFPSRNVT